MENNETNISLNLPEFKTMNTIIEGNDCIFEVVPKETQKECPECLSSNVVKNGSYERFVRDMDCYEYSIGIKLFDNRYLCNDCGKHFVPDYVSIAPKSRLTERLIKTIRNKALKEPFSHIANEYKITVPTVKKVFNDYVNELERERIIRAPKVLGIDEAHLNKNIRGVFVDVENHLVIEMLPKRTKASVVDYFNQLPNPNDIEVVTMDMCRPYKEAVLECLPNSKIVIDRFHVVKLVTDALNNYKISLIKKLNDNSLNSREIKKLLLSNIDTLNEEGLAKLNSLLKKVPELQIPYSLKEEFRCIYECETRDDAEMVYSEWVKKVKSKSSCYNSVVETIERWHEYIFNFFDYRYTNGITECLNNVIKSIERAGRGYTFEVLRAKVLFLNSAAKPAKFHFTKSGPRNKPIMGLVASFDFSNTNNKVKVYDSGFGTDLFELQQLLNSDSF